MLGTLLAVLVGPLPLTVAVTIRVTMALGMLAFPLLYWAIIAFRLLLVFCVSFC